VVDFIDMEERRNRDKVMAALDQALNQDRRPRKRFPSTIWPGLHYAQTHQASPRTHLVPAVPYCTGSGMSSPSHDLLRIQTEARKMAADLKSQSLTLRVNPEIAKTLKTRESSLIEELEQATRKSSSFSPTRRCMGAVRHLLVQDAKPSRHDLLKKLRTLVRPSRNIELRCTT